MRLVFCEDCIGIDGLEGDTTKIITLSFSFNNRILLNHNPILIDCKSSFTILKNNSTIPTTRSFPSFFGSLQGFFKGMAVVGSHIGGKDILRYGQGGVQVKIITYAPTLEGLVCG